MEFITREYLSLTDNNGDILKRCEVNEAGNTALLYFLLKRCGVVFENHILHSNNVQ